MGLEFAPDSGAANGNASCVWSSPNPAQPKPGPSPAQARPGQNPNPISFWRLARLCLCGQTGLCLRWAHALFCRRPRPGTIANFAPALIAAKPVKPCDRGVFGALDWLLIQERQTATQAAFGQARTRPKPEPGPNPARIRPKPSPTQARPKPDLSPT